MSKDAKPRVKVGSTLRVELHLSNFLACTMALSCEGVGVLQRMLFAEACREEIPQPTSAAVQRAFDRREQYRVIKGGFGRYSLSLATRRAVFERDFRTCGYCQSALTWKTYHCDHVEPVSKGGSSDMSNLRASCQPCNLAKSAKLLSEWAR